jgi:acyl-coenzyme A thioesterase 9
MQDTKIQSVQIMQPQYRNRHNFMIFGGFLLKSTFELAFTCASANSHVRPKFIALDPSTFENPVPVGSVLYLTATVAYTDSPLVPSGDKKVSPEGSTRIQIRVDSEIRNVEHGETKPTGQFNYTFEVSKDIKIVPQTYGQFMIYLDARRRAQHVTSSLEVPKSVAASESVMS